jgi:hypothetical protein
MKYLTCAETAKLIRAALKTAFPSITFTVKSKTYSGGASIRVGWTDGPTEYEIKQVTGRFEGATFDGMIDLKSYVTGDLNGEQVHFGADFIFCEREYSAAFLARRAETVAAEWGRPVPEIFANSFGATMEQDYSWTAGAGRTLADLIMQKAARTRSV